MIIALIAYDDETDGEASRLTHRSEHLRLAETLKLAGKLILGVALLSPENKITGSLMIFSVISREEMEEILSHEPYIIYKTWKSYQVTIGIIPDFFNIPIV